MPPPWAAVSASRHVISHHVKGLMMDRLTCFGCRFWDHPVWRTDGAVGPITMDCRRHAPVVCRPDDDGVYENATWPRTKADHWCADAEPEPPDLIAERERQRKEIEASPFAKYSTRPPPKRPRPNR